MHIISNLPVVDVAIIRAVLRHDKVVVGRGRHIGPQRAVAGTRGLGRATSSTSELRLAGLEAIIIEVGLRGCHPFILWVPSLFSTFFCKVVITLKFTETCIIK